MEFVEFKGKTLDEALMKASVELGCASTDLEYNVVSEGSTGSLYLECNVLCKIFKSFFSSCSLILCIKLYSDIRVTLLVFCETDQILECI